MYGMCSGLSNWWPCWFRRARQAMCPPLFPPPVFHPQPHFSCLRRRRRRRQRWNTRERSLSHTKNDVCSLSAGRVQGACCTAHNPLLHPHPTYSASHHRHPPCPSSSCSPRPVSLHPAATPSAAVRAARHATPPGGDSYYFHFSNSVWGAGNVQHPPLCSLSTHPSLLLSLLPSVLRLLYHPRGLSLFSPPPPPSR